MKPKWTFWEKAVGYSLLFSFMGSIILWTPAYCLITNSDQDPAKNIQNQPQKPKDDQQALKKRKRRRSPKAKRKSNSQGSPEKPEVEKKKEEPIIPVKGFETVEDRWRTLYKKNIIDPYNQNVLKGDYPVFGQDTFFSFRADAVSKLQFFGMVPTPSGVATNVAGQEAFFGDSRRLQYNQDFRFTFELFKGETAFRPRDWELRVVPAVNINILEADERGVVNVDVREDTSRLSNDLALQEASFEYHIADTSRYYDFISAKVGIQLFNSDFRGIIFEDANLGVRILGNADNNFWQYNFTVFEMLEKDTNSQLNTFNNRDQRIAIANVYKQDFLVKGYTLQLSYHYNNDGPSLKFDDNRFLVRPDPIGGVAQHEVEAHYLGFAGDGHWKRLNINHFFYWAFGDDDANPTARQEVDIDAFAAGVELSIDQDWLRYRLSYLYGSGDKDPNDDKAEGFDAIFPNPNFVGGRNGYWVSQAIPLAGTAVQLVNQDSVFPNLRSSRIQGQSNFVNPGIHFFNVGMDLNLTPKLRTTLNFGYLTFDDTSSLELIQNQEPISKEIGSDVSVGFEWRPWLNNNVLIDVGMATFIPGKGFEQLLENDQLYSVTSRLIFTY